MRKVLCSLGAGSHQELLSVSSQTFALYAQRHDYDLDLRHEVLAPDRPAAWSKVPLIRELLRRYDLVLWIDCDAAIVDPTLDIADELERRDLMGLVAHEYDGQAIPNCGVWILRRSRAVMRFLDAVWRRTEFLDHEWWENAAVLDELGYTLEPRVESVRTPRIRSRTRYVDRSWNSIQIDTAAHPRVNHYPGRSHEYRLAQLTRDVETARAAIAALAHPSTSAP